MTFSVIMPVYNRADTILRAVNSVFAQTHKMFELIVVDDGSTDRTPDVLKDIEDERFQYIRQNNRERSAARNAGFEASSGEYVTFLDSDDEAEREWLSLFFDLFRSTGAAVVCVGYKKKVKEKGFLKEKSFFPKNLGPLFHDMTCMFWPAGTFAVRRDLFEAVGGYAEDMTYSENTELGLRLITECRTRGEKVVTADAAMIHYHINSASVRTQPAAILTSMAHFLSRHPEALSRDPRVFGYYLAMAGVNAARLGGYGEAKRYFIKAIRVHPGNITHYFRFGLALFPSFGQRIWRRH